METLKGVGVSTGIAIGQALLLLDEETVVVRQRIPKAGVSREIKRFRIAIEEARCQVEDIKAQVKDRIGDEHALIFDAHGLILEDEDLIRQTTDYIEAHRCSAEWAFNQVLMRLLKAFDALEDPYFAERAKDLEDVGKRLLKILVGNKSTPVKDFKRKIIAIGSEFGPSHITSFDHPNIVGFATDLGGQTTHTAIIAKALGVPAVLGLHRITRHVTSGDTLILDSDSGQVIVDPDAQTLLRYRRLIQSRRRVEARYIEHVDQPAVSKDGIGLSLLANIEVPQEVAPAFSRGAEGIGLYRTEFLFLQVAPDFPTEEDHYRTYCDIAEAAGDRPVTIRTLDLGGEKFFHRTFSPQREANPVMGLRGVRLCLNRKDIFRIQLRGLIRAAAQYPNIRIMFPLITGVNELSMVRRFFDSIRSELVDEGLKDPEHLMIGIMIEVPSAAMVSDYLALEVDFFSIGTNDLIQYFLAIDRSNDDVNYLYDPFHPGFVRLLSMTVENANRAGIPVCCCGEMASSPLYACLLVLLGIRSLSMNPSSIPNIHHLIRSMDFQRLRAQIPDPIQGPTGWHAQRTFTQALKTILLKRDYRNLIEKIAIYGFRPNDKKPVSSNRAETNLSSGKR